MPFSETVDVDGQPAFRILVPEYYGASCLSCHGEPVGRNGRHRLSRRRAARKETSGPRSASPSSNDGASTPDGQTASGRGAAVPPVPSFLRHRSIPLRVAALSALLLGALIVTNAIVVRELYRSSERIVAATELFEQLEAASGANESFGDIRYWMTDLAVSQLTISERNANEARADAGRTISIGSASTSARSPRKSAQQTDAYMAKALEAVDAYTDDQRVIGNTLLAEAREHSAIVEARLAELTDASARRCLGSARRGAGERADRHHARRSSSSSSSR